MKVKHWTTGVDHYTSDDAGYITTTVHCHGDDGFIEARVEFVERDGKHSIIIKHSGLVDVVFKPLTTAEDRRGEDIEEAV